MLIDTRDGSVLGPGPETVVSVPTPFSVVTMPEPLLTIAPPEESDRMKNDPDSVFVASAWYSPGPMGFAGVRSDEDAREHSGGLAACLRARPSHSRRIEFRFDGVARAAGDCRRFFVNVERPRCRVYRGVVSY